MRLRAIFLLCFFAIFAAAQTSVDSDAEQEIFRLLNLARARAGLKSLRFDSNLQKAARQHSRIMADANQLSHQFGAEPPFSQRLALAGAAFDMSGENVAVDQTAEGAHEGLMHSPPHRANILKPEFNAVGIGVVRAGHDIWVTQDFAREFEKESPQDARNTVISAFQQARRKAGAPPVKIVDEPRLQTLACQMAKQGKLDTRAALAATGVRTATSYTEPDLSNLPSTARKLAEDPNVRQVAVAVCFARSKQYEAGMNWIVIAGY